jgi:FKBP-type peptidyl-prolyl cis-trans isomerase
LAQRTVCLCDGKYIGIETIYTVINGKQINIPEKLNDLRKKSRSNQLFCPCGCSSNLILVAGDRNLRTQHFRLKDGELNSSCEAVIEGQNSIDSKIVLKCWLDDKLPDSNIESRVPVRDVSNITRKYEFIFLSRSRRVGLSFCNERVNLSEEKINLLKENSKGISVIYVVDMRNFGNDGQYPEGVMKVQNEQGYCLFLSVSDRDYSIARLRATFSIQDIDGLWQEVILAEDNLDKFTINDGKVVYQSIALNDLLERSKVEWKAGIEEERVEREERRKRQEDERRLVAEREAKMREERERQERVEAEERRRRWEEEQKLVTERAAKQREEAEKARAEAEERKRIEDQERIEAEIRFADSLLERMNQQEEQVRDPQGRRLVKCKFCGKIAHDSKFSSYGGINHINLGICRECQRNNPEAKIIRMPEPENKAKIEINKCPNCGGNLKEKTGMYGRFVSCSSYPNCRYTRSIK